MDMDIRDYGYRCPDTEGICDSAWVQGDGSGLSNPSSFAGAYDFGAAGFSEVYGVGAAKTNFRRVGTAGIGIQSIIDQNPIDAIDIWGEGASPGGKGGEVCFKGHGRIVFLDASTSPRAQSTLSTHLHRSGTQTCTRIPGAGTVVFLPPEGGGNGNSQSQAQGQGQGQGDSGNSQSNAQGESDDPQNFGLLRSAPLQRAEGCSIITTGHLKLRERPSLDAEILYYVPRGSTPRYITRNWSWFNVEFQGLTGWIGAAYVSATGNCG